MKKKAMMAFALSAALVMQMSMTVLAADDVTTPVDVYGDGVEKTVGNVTIDNTTQTAVTAADGASVTVEGNINANYSEQKTDSASGQQYLQGENGANAYNNGSVTVKGDVSATQTGVSENSATVTVDGNISAGSSGISALNGGSVKVTGNVTATGTETVTHSYDSSGNEVDRHVRVSGTGVNTDGTSNIEVGGNITGITNGILINLNHDGKAGGNIVVKGVISRADGGQPIQLNPGYDRGTALSFNSVDEALAAFPSFTVYGIDSKAPEGFFISKNTVKDSELTEAVKKTAYETKISYIVKQDEATADKYTVISGLTKGSEYNTVRLADTVKVKAAEGYTISGGDNVTVTDNGDGTYDLKLKTDRGMFNIYAILKAVSEATGQKIEDVEVAVTTDNSGNVAVYADPNQAPAGAIVVSAATVSAASSASTGDNAAPVSDKPTRTVSYDISKITPMQYKNSIIENVAEAPADGSFCVVTNRVSCFDSKMIDAFAARRDVDVEVVFPLGGQMLKVVIPAGYDVRLLLDEHGYCGFLRLASLLGFTPIK